MTKKGKNGKSGKNNQTPVAKKDKTWNIDDTTNHSCPHARTRINIPSNLFDEIMKVYLYGLKNDIEISIYAKVVDKCITEIYIPAQENGTAAVGIQETVPLTWNCIIHSHPSGVTHFSQQDWHTLMVNRDYCLLINQGRFTDGKARLTMPCGCVMYSDIIVITPLDDDLGQKIKKKNEPEVENVCQWGEEMTKYYQEMYNDSILGDEKYSQ